MRSSLKLLISFMVFTLILADVYAFLSVTWQAPVSVRIGELTQSSVDISLRCSPSVIEYGGTTTIDGKLVNATDNGGLPGHTLDLYYRSSFGSPWEYITAVSTAYDGSFSLVWSDSSSLAVRFYTVNATFTGGGGFDPWTSVTDFQVVCARKMLSVPYYYQGDTHWCMPTSMSMIFRYYGQNIHSWDIAKDWEWGRVVGGWELEALPYSVKDYFETHGLTAELRISPLEYNFDTMKNWIDRGMPIILSMSAIEHAVSIVGYSSTEDCRKIYINDPSGHLVNEVLSLSESYPFVAVELSWDDIAGHAGWLSYAIAVSGTPQVPKGTIDMQDYGVFFSTMKKPDISYVYSWFYGLDKGLVWDNIPTQPLALNPENQFKIKNPIVNHMKDRQTYLFEISFAVYDPSTTLWLPFSTLWLTISIEGRSSEDIQLGPFPLRDLFFPGHGDYKVTLRLWDESHEEKYDEVVFPSIKYESRLMFQIDSPVDLYVTDPQSRHVGIDPSTGQVINEIPEAVYTGPGTEPQVIAIPDPLDGDYAVLLIGRAASTYSLTAELVTLQGATAFTATDIPTATGALHNCSFDWAALSAGEEGVTVNVDSNGDGVFEYNFTSDSELSRIEYVAATTKHDLGITGITSLRRVIGEGYTLPINITVMNYGVYTEAFNVTIYANSTLILTQMVALANASSATVTCTWNTSGFVKGNYTISAFVEPAPSETYIADNEYTAGTVIVTIPGDVNGDRKVDASDLDDLNNAYGSTLGSPKWNPNCDINGDNKVDVIDLFLQSKNYGKTDP